MQVSLKLNHGLNLIAVFVLAIALAAWRFMPYVSSIFYGDDLFFYLSMIDGNYGAKLSDLFLHTYQERFRPVGFGYAVLLFNMFGASPHPQIAVNLLLQGLSALLVFLTVRRSSGGNWLLAFTMALAVASFRFATVSITQIIAAEALSFLLFMALVYSVLRANESPQRSLFWGWLSILFGFLTIHTHERYIVVFVWLFMFFLLSPTVRQLPNGRRIGLILTSLCIPILNVVYKMVVLHTPFFVGTGGTYIEFNILRVLWHLAQAVFSIFGFNVGPEYLIGAQITNLPWSFAWLFALVLTASWLILLYGLFRTIQSKDIDNKLEIVFFPLMLLFLGCLLLIPAISTIRVEQRWLMGSFVCIVILFPAWIPGRISKVGKFPSWLLASAITCSVVLLDGIYIKSFGNLYIAQSANIVEAVKRNVIGSKVQKSQEVIFFNTGVEHCSWTLANGRIFQIYAKHSQSVKCIANMEESLKLKTDDEARIFFLTYQKDEWLKEITNEWHGWNRANSSREVYNFLSNFQFGIINNDAKMDTPSGKGVMHLPWKSTVGDLSTLTIVSGFSYRFDDVEIPSEAFLLSGVSMIYPSKSHAHAVIGVESKGTNSITSSYLIDLAPPMAGSQLKFYPISISLRQFQGKRVSVTFSVETSGGNSDGHWVGYAYPRIATGE